MSDKITPQHLERTAYVYVRQSTAHQVRHHLEGQRRQYELADRARAMGFAKTVVIDDDLGRSGSGLQERPGFGRLLNAVCVGEAGGVFSLEASRLARNNRDWHHLVDLCAMTQTLLIDDEGVYDPRELNDRLLLGLKGTMSEFELGLFRQRARQAFEQKVQRGHAMWEVPVGFVRNEEDRIEKTPDLQVQHAIEGVFKKFQQLGSARQATLWYRDEQIALPLAVPGSSGQQTLWRLPSGHRIDQIIKNPCYAGALAYGRTESATRIENGRATQVGRRKKPREKWKTLILDNHEGYISWQRYLQNQETMQANVMCESGQTGGAAKGGAALLSGLLRCGRCGRRLNVNYSGVGGRVPRYTCQGNRAHRGSAACLSLGALRIDTAVCEQLLEAIEPAGIEAAVEAHRQLSSRNSEKLQALQLTLEKARYQAQRAHRQYETVDPDNRLVASELERRWNQALETLSGIEEQIEQISVNHEDLSQEDEVRLFALGKDVRSLWEHSQSPAELKKRILRTVLVEVIVDNTDDPPEHLLCLHWKGGMHTEQRIPRNTSGCHRHVAKPETLELVRELSKVCGDEAIAATLNRLGYRTGMGKTWRKHSVWNLRHTHQLKNYRNAAQWLTVEQSAGELGVSSTVIKRLIQQAILPAAQVVASAPWIIERADLALPDVQAQVQTVKQGRQLPHTSRNQSELPFKQDIL